MTENDTTTATTPSKESNPRKTAALVGMALMLAIVVWLLGSKYFGIAGAERQGMVSSASAFSSAALPLLDLRSKNLLGDPDALQRVVNDIVDSNNFSFAAILDAEGRVVASSDRNAGAGTKYEGFAKGAIVELSNAGKREVIHPISQSDVVYGAVVLRSP